MPSRLDAVESAKAEFTVGHCEVEHSGAGYPVPGTLNLSEFGVGELPLYGTQSDGLNAPWAGNGPSGLFVMKSVVPVQVIQVSQKCLPVTQQMV